MKQAVSLDREETSLFRDFFELNGWVVFIFICLCYGLMSYAVQEYVITNEVYYNTFGEQLTMARVSEILDFQKKFLPLRLAIIPLVVFLQIFLASICINVGLLLSNMKVAFGKLFSIVMKASLIFVIGKVLQLFIALATEIKALPDFQKTDIFSLNGLLSNLGMNVNELLTYPLSLINIFEIAFVVVTGIGLSLAMQKESK